MTHLPKSLVRGLTAAALVAALSQLSPAPQALSNGGSITTLGVALTESFDALASTGTGMAWVDNVTIPGWYSTRVAYNGGTGSSNTGALYSFGIAATNSVTDRALGSVASGSTGIIYHAARLTNSTGGTITSLDISYVGEQWRNGGNTTAHTLSFQYQVANAGVITGANAPSAGWTNATALNFVGPVATATAGALDGNAAANRTLVAASLALTVEPGQEIWLRWADTDDAGSDHGLAIDDFSVIAHGAVVDQAPAVTTTAPSAGSSNVPVESTVVVTFSETVHAAAGAFALSCGAPQAFTQSPSPATSFTLTPSSPLPHGAVCTVTVTADQITDADADDPPDQMVSDVVFSFDTASAIDAPPGVLATSPLDGATNVSVGSNIAITFDEEVTATVTAFAIDSGGPQSFSLTSSPAATFTLDPDVDLPYATTCTVSVSPGEVSDTDTNDPPDQMAAGVSVSFTTANPPPPAATGILINEVDADNVGTDAAEFVELYDGGVGNTPLDGLTVVFFNGSNDLSYAAFDLDGAVTSAEGYFTLGNAGVPGVDLVFPGNFLQNGADAVAVFVGNATDFPNNTPVTLANLQDALVYDSDDADDAGLLVLLNPAEPQINENGGGNITGHSMGRCADGAGGARNTSIYRTGSPSPDGPNDCPPPPPPPADSDIVISQVYGGGGSTGAAYQNDYVELYNRGTTTIDTAGWSLQYASATGSGWDFNKTPLGGPIAPGEYYLVRLASNGTNGSALPPANVAGPINLSGSQGKIALVGSFEALSGNCPLANPNLKDLVGYGGADCGEGSTTAPSPSDVSTALFRLGSGATDTNTNSLDFATGAALPRRTAPIVELGPLVLSTDPSTNGTNAPRDPTIVITFTEPVDVVDPWFDITCTVTGQHNSHTLAGNGTILNITPNVNLLAGEQCTVTLFASQIHDQDLDDAGPHTDTLPVDYVWSFTVASGTPPPYPPSVHLTFGNPSNAVTDLGQPNNYLMEKPEFALSYDRDLGRPNWVSWHLSTEWYGNLPRVDTFRADPQVPPAWYRVQGFDFSGSGFDRGHMVPNADRDPLTSIPINQATFLMTNMVAQAPGNNQGPWASLENYLRTLTDAGDELYIVAGPAGVGGTGSLGGVATTIANGQVTVPASTWKAALVLPAAGGDDVSRVTCATRTIAVIMPNQHSIGGDAWESHLTSVDAIESLTGYDLFASLPDQVEYCVEAGVNGNNPPEDLDPPVIQCQPADGAWHGDNVTLACTAGDVGSGLANPADSSFWLSTSVTAGSEDANADTDSRMVCDVAGNCAVAGPMGGNQIDRKAPSVTVTTPAAGAVYQTGKLVASAYACADDGAGVASCSGAVANGSPIDTASAGSKSFLVTATDTVGNIASVTVYFAVASNAISISNIPEAAAVGDSFEVTFDYAGDGATSVTSMTPFRCSVAGNTVTFVRRGHCRLVAHATGTATFDPSTGPVQSFEITKRTATISIANIPGGAVNGGSFIPVLAYTGDGTTRVRSESPEVCRVHHDGVRFVGGGTCTLVAIGRATEQYFRVVGDPQSFIVAPATVAISIRNLPNTAKVGKWFVPHFDYDGNGDTSVSSSTPTTCNVQGKNVTFVAVGACTLTAQATATANFTAATGPSQSVVVK